MIFRFGTCLHGGTKITSGCYYGRISAYDKSGKFCRGRSCCYIVNAITGATDKSHQWYPDKDHINSKVPHLAYYFFLLAGLMFLNFIVYIFVAVRFKEKKESARKANLVAHNIANKQQPGVPSEEVQDDEKSPCRHPIGQDSG